MNLKLGANQEGVTLIELLVALVVSAVIVAGVYRVFTTQTRTYTVQAEVVDVQQNIRSVMELILRDVRMAAYKSNVNPVTLAASIFPGDTVTARSDAIRVEYQRSVDCNGAAVGNPQRHMVVYYMDNGTLKRDLQVAGNTCNQEEVLRNVNLLRFTYGVDGIVGLDSSQNGAMDDQNGDGIINDDDWVSPTAVINGDLNVIAIRIELTAEPSNPNANPDVANIVPRNLVSTVNVRNLCLIKDN